MTNETLTDRFFVFRYILKHMEQHEACPTGSRVAHEVGISIQAALIHMRALKGADGLPMAVVIIRGRPAKNGDHEPLVRVDDYFGRVGA